MSLIESLAYRRYLIIVSTLLLLAGAAIYLTWLFYQPIVFDNHLVENLQVLFLALAAIFSAQNAQRLRQHSLDFYVRVFLVFFALAFGLRELDVDTIISGQFGKNVENTLRLLVGIPFLCFIAFLCTKFRFLWQSRAAVFHSPVFHFVVAGCLCYVVGWPFDKKVFANLSFEQCQVAEEILEFWGTALIMMGAWWRFPLARQ